MLGALLLASTLAVSAADPAQCVPPRDARGRIARSHQAVAEFKRLHPCPATGRRSGRCPGYVVDHIVALKRCGPDRPDNMQWQTIQDARAKDRWE